VKISIPTWKLIRNSKGWVGGGVSKPPKKGKGKIELFWKSQSGGEESN